MTSLRCEEVAATIPWQEFEDITECPICMTTFENPRALPCAHTFCARCIQACFQFDHKKRKIIITCPCCRRPCELPANAGVDDLPKNCPIARLIEVGRTRTNTEKSEFDIPTTSSTAADTTASIMVSKLLSSYRQFSEDFRQRKAASLERLQEEADRYVALEDQLNGIENEFTNRLEFSGCLIDATAKRMHQYINEHQRMLLNDIREIKTEKLTEMQSLRQVISDRVTKIECLRHHVVNLPNVCGEGLPLTETAVEEEVRSLTDNVGRHTGWNVDVSEIQKRLDSLEITTNSLEYTEFLNEGDASDVNLVGTLWCGGNERQQKIQPNISASTGDVTIESSPTLLGVLRRPTVDRAVSAVATFGDRIYVGLYLQDDVEVYDASTLDLKCLISFKKSKLVSLTVCPNRRVLYVADVADPLHCIIRRMSLLARSKTHRDFPVADDPRGLSIVPDNCHLLVTCGLFREIQEYTTDGIRLRGISLEFACTGTPFHCVQLSSGNLVVCLNDPDEVVLLHQIGHNFICSSKQTVDLDHPRGLTVDDNGRIVVADSGNKRILVFNSDLTHCHQLIVDLQASPMESPMCVCSDVVKGRLYVGNIGGQVIVYNST